MRTDPQFKIRLPPEMKEWLEREASKNLRSMTAEVVLSVRERMERQSRMKATSTSVTAPAEA